MIIYQPLDGYCYNSDTIFLYHFVSLFHPKGSILDIGTGSGILALLVARDFSKDVSAIEVQERFVQYAKINAQANRLPIQVYLGNFLHMVFDKKFDYLVSNPPFYHKDVVRSQKRAIDIARYSGHLPLDEFLKKSFQILKPKGGLFFCYDAKQIKDIVAKLEKHKFNIEALKFVHPKAHRAATLVMVYAKKASKSLCTILPPLIVFDENGYSDEAMEAFHKAGVHSIKCQL